MKPLFSSLSLSLRLLFLFSSSLFSFYQYDQSDDIDAILAHGEQRTEEMSKMVTASMENNLQNFTLDGKAERECGCDHTKY